MSHWVMTIADNNLNLSSISVLHTLKREMTSAMCLLDFTHEPWLMYAYTHMRERE